MSRYDQAWPDEIVGDLTQPQIWVIRQRTFDPGDDLRRLATRAVVLIDFSRLADDRATFALLGHAWAGATATRSAWSQEGFDELLQQEGDVQQQLLAIVFHAPADTPESAIHEAWGAVRAARPALSLIVSDEPAVIPLTGMTGVVHSASGRRAIDALALVRMLVSLASPNEWACLDVEDVLAVCTSADEAGSMSLRLITGAWLADTSQMVFPGKFDAELFAHVKAVWLHVDAWHLRGDDLREILHAMRVRCDADVTMVINAPFRHALVAAWTGSTTSLLLLVRS